MLSRDWICAGSLLLCNWIGNFYLQVDARILCAFGSSHRPWSLKVKFDYIIKSRCAFLIANISSPKSFPWRNDAATFDFHFRVQTENYWNFEAGSPLRVVKVNWISSIYDPATLKLHVATFPHSERVKTFHNWYENEKDFWGDRAT